MSTFKSRHLDIDKPIASWKGQEIVLFQEDLLEQVKGSISEKSFYTYFKNDPKKLPRIDILNLLSQYVGYASWSSFSKEHKVTQPEKKKAIPSYAYVFLSFLIVFLIITMASGYFQKENTFHFCFIDTDRGAYIQNIPLDIIILKDNQSSVYTKSDSVGCFSWTTKDEYIQFVVQSPYHKTDTIKRYINESSSENIPLLTDDYNLMLHFYANNNISDWKKRRNQLHQLIAENAILIQILPYEIGLEIYTKEDFIDKLTTPTKSLKDFEIIESQKQDGKIVKLKFRTNYE